MSVASPVHPYGGRSFDFRDGAIRLGVEHRYSDAFDLGQPEQCLYERVIERIGNGSDQCTAALKLKALSQGDGRVAQLCVRVTDQLIAFRGVTFTLALLGCHLRRCDHEFHNLAGCSVPGDGPLGADINHE